MISQRQFVSGQAKRSQTEVGQATLGQTEPSDSGFLPAGLTARCSLGGKSSIRQADLLTSSLA